MTIKGYGRLLPVQCMILNLAGYRLGSFVESHKKWISVKKKKEIMYKGWSDLVKLTKKDFGFKLLPWHNYLKNNDESDEFGIFGRFGYNHPYGKFITRLKLYKALLNPRRLWLVRQLENEQRLAHKNGKSQPINNSTGCA